MPSRFPVDWLPEAEQPHARALRGNLSNLSTYIGRFRSALALVDHCETLLFQSGADFRRASLAMDWSMIACRDAALSVWHFGQALNAAQNPCLSSCPTLMARADFTALRQLRKRFNAMFRGYDDIRQAVAHSADNQDRPSTIEAHAITKTQTLGGVRAYVKGNARIVLGQAVHGRTFTTARRGQLHQFQITQQSLANLLSVEKEANDVYAALFAPAAKPEEAT